MSQCKGCAELRQQLMVAEHDLRETRDSLVLAQEENQALRATVKFLKKEEARLRERLVIDPGGIDRIDELEQALQFCRHGQGRAA